MLLRELWRLWEERPREKGCYVYFAQKYEQSVQRLRRTHRQRRVNNALLFDLIKKFISAQNIETMEPEMLRTHLRPPDRSPLPGSKLPAGVPYNSGLIAYEIDVGASTKRYLVLKVPTNAPPQICCPAISFVMERLGYHVGLYYFHWQEAVLGLPFWQSINGEPRHLIYGFASGATTVKSIRMRLSTRDAGLCEVMTDSSTSRRDAHLSKYRVSDKREILERAEQFYRNFDI